MSKLSFENIDRWLFEWGEGNLNPTQIEELQAFLDIHPELAIDVDAWSVASVTAENVTYPNVSSLSKERKIAPFWLGVSATSLLFLVVLGGIWYFQKPISATYSKTTIDANFESSNKIQLANTSRVNILRDGIVLNNAVKTNGSNNEGASLLISKNENSINRNQSNLLAKENELKDSNLSSKRSVGLDSKNNNDNFAPSNTSNETIDKDLNSTYTDYIEIETYNNEQYDDQYANVVASLSKNKTGNSIEGENDITLDQNDLAENSNSSNKGSEKSALEMFSSKLNRFARKVKRMADNPVALTNTKDPIYLIPGKLASDISFSSAGNLIAPRVQAQSRIQWLGQKDQQLMNRLSVDGYVYALRGGLGFDVSYNNYAINTIQTFEAAVTYSPKLSINKNMMFEPAVRFKMGNDRISPSSDKMGSQIEFERRNVKQLFAEGETPIGSNLWYRDLGFGATLHSKWFFIGANVDNVLEHSNNIYTNDVNSDSRAPLAFNATAGTEYLSRRNMLLSTYATYQKYGGLNEFWLGANLTVASVFMGVAMNSNLEPAASVGIKTKTFMFLYGADYMKSSVNEKSFLSHQVTIRARFKPSPMNRRFLKI